MWWLEFAGSGVFLKMSMVIGDVGTNNAPFSKRGVESTASFFIFPLALFLG